MPVVTLKDGYSLGSITPDLLRLISIPAPFTGTTQDILIACFLKDSCSIQRLERVSTETACPFYFHLSFAQVWRHLEAAGEQHGKWERT